MDITLEIAGAFSLLCVIGLVIWSAVEVILMERDDRRRARKAKER